MNYEEACRAYAKRALDKEGVPYDAITTVEWKDPYTDKEYDSFGSREFEQPGALHIEFRTSATLAASHWRFRPIWGENYLYKLEMPMAQFLFELIQMAREGV